MNNCRWISKGDWFDEGTEAYLLCIITEECGLFEGTKDGQDDQETCPFEEFYILGYLSE